MAQDHQADIKHLNVLIEIIIQFYSVKDSFLFSFLIEDEFFEVTFTVFKALNLEKSEGACGAHPKVELKANYYFLHKDSVLYAKIYTFLKFKWVFKNILEFNLSSKDLSAYTFFLTDQQNEITTEILNNSEFSNQISLNNQDLYNCFEKLVFRIFDGNNHVMLPLYFQKKALQQLAACLLAISLRVVDGAIVFENLEQSQIEKEIYKKIEIFYVLSDFSKQETASVLRDNPKIIDVLFGFAICQLKNTEIIYHLLQNVFQNELFLEKCGGKAVIKRCLHQFLVVNRLKPTVGLFNLLFMLLKCNLQECIQDLLSEVSIL